jgi:hypothetical protein
MNNTEKKTYIVKVVDKGVKLDWSGVDVAALSFVGWGTEYKPECTARVYYESGAGLHVKMTCREKNPLTRYTKFFDNVYEDSCLEFFSCVDGGANYMNIEVNSRGTMLCAIGPDRHNRTPINEVIALHSESSAYPMTAGVEDEGEVWFIEYFVPAEALATVFGINADDIKPGFVMRGNFYKCGNDTEFEHYLTWSPILTARPDYHRPEYFGNLIFK